MTPFVRQRDLLATFGNPTHVDWADSNIAYLHPPFEMWAGKVPVHHIPIHKTLTASLNGILDDIWEASGRNQKKIHEWGCDCFSGSWAVRNVRGGKKLSAHAWAYAIDLDAPHNPLGKKGRFHKDHPVVKAFKRAGWSWGGDFRKRVDPMHFTASGG